jgi:hypothetical protein
MRWGLIWSSTEEWITEFSTHDVKNHEQSELANDHTANREVIRIKFIPIILAGC